MRTAVVGAGPAGLYTAIALARRGHEVTVVDRDPGPRLDGSWSRKGVMQSTIRTASGSRSCRRWPRRCPRWGTT